MRCRSLVLLSALLMLLTGCAQEAPAEPIFAIVEGVEIPVSRVDHTLALDEAAYEFSLRWIEDADFLTEEEKQVYRRGRNAQASSRAKNATMSDYRHATGLEALFGYLYLTGQGDRMTELAEQCLNYYDEQILTKERKQKHEI